MQPHTDRLNGIFLALADPTRRVVIGQLSKGPASVTDLAEPFEMALPSFLKHIRFLEEHGLIKTRKQGRVRTCEIDRKQFAVAEDWLSKQRDIWEGRADRLEAFVAKLQKEKSRK
jgi:DNA-binding transcriptional ArsR family regulator